LKKVAGMGRGVAPHSAAAKKDVEAMSIRARLAHHQVRSPRRAGSATALYAAPGMPVRAQPSQLEPFMQYMLIFNESTAEVARRDDPAAAPAYWGAWQAYIGALGGAGVIVSGNGLQPPRTATIVRMVGGQRQVQDGPFADTHEHLGGYFIVEVASLDEALAWAARAPCASAGSVEVRPVLPPPAQ
jgi:hypothetical protein